MTSWISRSRLPVVGRLLLVGGIAMILLLGFNAAQLSVHGPTHVYAAAGDTRSHPFTTSTNLLQPSGYTGSELTAWLNKTHPGSRLAAYGGSFATAESNTGISAQGLLALAIVQTGWGASISGNDVYAISGHSYSSIGTGIVNGAVWIKQNYLTSGGPYYAGATLAGMGRHYATSASWPGLVASVAQQMYSPDPAATLTPVSPKVSSPAPAPVSHSPAPVTQSPAPVTHSPAPVTQSPAPVTQSPAPVTQSPAPVTQSPAPAANPPAAQPPADPNAGDSGNSGTPPDNSGTPPDNSGTPPDNSGTPPDNSGTPPDNGNTPPDNSSGSSGDGSTDPGAWTPPPTQVPAPAPQQTCIPLLQPALALGLQPCIPLGNANSHGPAGAKAPKDNGKNQSSTGDGQSGAPQSSSQDPSNSSSDGSTGSGSGSAGSTGSGSAGSATSSSGSAGSTGSGSGSSGSTGSGGGTTGSSSTSGGSTGSGGAAGAPAGGVAPTPASQASSSPQAAAVKEVSLVASSGDGLAWPAVLGGLALFLGLALLVLGRRSPSRAKPPRR